MYHFCSVLGSTDCRFSCSCRLISWAGQLKFAMEKSLADEDMSESPVGWS